jgi:hypothetical protein
MSANKGLLGDSSQTDTGREIIQKTLVHVSQYHAMFSSSPILFHPTSVHTESTSQQCQFKLIDLYSLGRTEWEWEWDALSLDPPIGSLLLTFTYIHYYTLVQPSPLIHLFLFLRNSKSY